MTDPAGGPPRRRRAHLSRRGKRGAIDGGTPVVTLYNYAVIGVIDYQTGNSRSVIYALEHLGLPCMLVSTPAEATAVDRLVLPGVGSAGVTMRSLSDLGWPAYLEQRVLGDGIPFLGICVGLQVLFDYSAEENAQCLGWLPGKVEAFPADRVRVPQIGWNRVVAASAHPFVEGLEDRSYFYFVNSYYATPDRIDDVAARTEYGLSFTSIVAHRNIMATQFHTEKSGPVGLQLLNRFTQLQKDDLSAD